MHLCNSKVTLILVQLIFIKFLRYFYIKDIFFIKWSLLNPEVYHVLDRWLSTVPVEIAGCSSCIFFYGGQLRAKIYNCHEFRPNANGMEWKMYARYRRVYARMYRCAINLLTIPALRSSACRPQNRIKYDAQAALSKHNTRFSWDEGPPICTKICARAVSSHPITVVRVANLVLCEIISVAIKINIHIRISFIFIASYAAAVSRIKIVIE